MTACRPSRALAPRSAGLSGAHASRFVQATRSRPGRRGTGAPSPHRRRAGAASSGGRRSRPPAVCELSTQPADWTAWTGSRTGTAPQPARCQAPAHRRAGACGPSAAGRLCQSRRLFAQPVGWSQSSTFGHQRPVASCSRLACSGDAATRMVCHAPSRSATSRCSRAYTNRRKSQARRVRWTGSHRRPGRTAIAASLRSRSPRRLSRAGRTAVARPPVAAARRSGSPAGALRLHPAATDGPVKRGRPARAAPVRSAAAATLPPAAPTGGARRGRAHGPAATVRAGARRPAAG